MLFPKSDIKEHIKNLGLTKTDTVMIHGDSGVAAQYIYEPFDDPLTIFIEEIISFFSEGTVIVPAFTYSATKGEAFDQKLTPSKVGLFSEKFRLKKGVIRSNHPIFSISAIGNNAEQYVSTLLNDCFGKETFFDKIYKQNAKIVTLGCALERMTFIHYVEQQLDVSYRFFKTFDAKIRDKNITKNLKVNYFARNLDLDTRLDLASLEKEAIYTNKLQKVTFGRYLGRTISADDCFNVAAMLIRNYEYALIKEGKI